MCLKNERTVAQRTLPSPSGVHALTPPLLPSTPLYCSWCVRAHPRLQLNRPGILHAPPAIAERPFHGKCILRSGGCPRRLYWRPRKFLVGVDTVANAMLRAVLIHIRDQHYNALRDHYACAVQQRNHRRGRELHRDCSRPAAYMALPTRSVCEPNHRRYCERACDALRRSAVGRWARFDWILR